MSHAATNWAIQQRGLRPIAKLLLWNLADCHNPVAGCFPTQEYLAEQCEISRASVNRYLADLEAVGLIRREQVIDPASKRQRPTRYRLAFESDFATPDVVPRVSTSDTEAVSQKPPSRVSETGKAVSQSFETLTCKGTSKEPMGAEEFFDLLFDKFPQRPGSVRGTALAAFLAIDRSDWPGLDSAVSAYRAAFDAECRFRGEDEDARSHFVPFMANWLAGDWRAAAKAATAKPAAPVTPTEFVDSTRNPSLFEACEMTVGKTMPRDKNGGWHFAVEVVAEARRQLAAADQEPA